MFISGFWGFVAGAAHVVSGPDHMAAVAPLVLDQKNRPLRAGLLWGLGHSGGVWMLAALALIFRESLPIDVISSWSERIVGVVLVFIGLWGLRQALRLHIHSHEHKHADGKIHEHVHAHPIPVGKENAPHEHHSNHHNHSHSLLGIGALHGFAGTSHFLGVLPALALPTRSAAIAYVIAFGLGSIIGMAVFAVGIARLNRAATRKSKFAARGLLATSSVAAIGIGAFWLYAQVVTGGH